MKKAILLSGGMDSIAIAYWLRKEISIAITINYGQKSAEREIEVSRKICSELNFYHEIITVDCGFLGAGEMSKNHASSLLPISEWWPYRNQLLITLGAMKAIAIDVNTLILGSVSTDNKFVDGSLIFSKTINKLMKMQEGSIKILTPAIKLTTVQLIKKSKIPDNILFWAHSCHVSNDPCGICNGCKKYVEVVEELN